MFRACQCFKNAASNGKPNVVILGSGWAGCYVAHQLDSKLCSIQMISTRNYMVFTPLLPQTTTGTLEFRAVCEPILNIQPALAKRPNRFYRAMIYDIDFAQKHVCCAGVGVLGTSSEVSVRTFNVAYDYLVIASGARPSTFNIPGVEEHAFFLREVPEAREIRKRLTQNIMAADLPVTSQEERSQLLHAVVVGGGPTGIEFAANLAEFFRKDIANINASLVPYCRVTLLEAGEVLGTFDTALRNYSQRRLRQLGVTITKEAVVGVSEGEVLLKSGAVLPTGLVVWSTGVGPSDLTRSLKCDKTNRGRLAIDDYLRVHQGGQVLPNVFACGDCAAHKEESAALPTLAAVASRQGAFLGKQLNQLCRGKPLTQRFCYKSLGGMVSLGDRSAAVALGNPSKKTLDITGLKAFVVWRSAYLTILGSFRNRMYVIANWVGSHFFGRDITYIADLSEDRVYANLAQTAGLHEKSRKQAVELLKSRDAPIVSCGGKVNPAPSEKKDAPPP